MKKIEVFCGVLESNSSKEHGFVFWVLLGGIYYRTSFLTYSRERYKTNKRGSLRNNLLYNTSFTTDYNTYERLIESIEKPRFSLPFNYRAKVIKVHCFLVPFNRFKKMVLNYCSEHNKTFAILNNEILKYMKEEELKEALKELDVFVDFGGGDKFMITPDEIDLEHKRLILKGSQGQLRWVRISERYDKQRKS